MGNLAIIQIRGVINVPQPIRDTLQMLRLGHKHVCVIVPDNPTTRGMIRKVKDLVTWGEIDEQTLTLLQEKRGQHNTESRPWFRLQPPRKGFERKGIKVPFKLGGALGDRGKEIGSLIQRML